MAVLSWLLPRIEARSPVVDSPIRSSVSRIAFFVRFRVDKSPILPVDLNE